MGFGLHLLGHSPGFVIEAMEKQLKKGIELGPQIYLAGKVCQLISELTGVERVNICNSGTEAVMGALRVARTMTRRNKIALFAGAYHGWSDGTQARPLTIDGKQRTVPNAPGVQPQAVEDVMVLEWNDPKSLVTLKEHAHELAAVLVEPVQSRRPDIQPREFLHELRRLTEQVGTALIFDEMVTGFRIENGGAQAFFGVKADLVIYGKVLGAGLPIGVVAGKAAYMDAFDGGMWNYGDTSYPTAEKTLFAGAYFKHPLTMATAWAILNHLKDNPDLLPQLNQKTTRLVNALNDYFQQSQLPVYVGQFGSLFRLLYPRDFKHMDLFFYHLLDNGVFLWEGRNCFLSPAHTDEDLEFIIEAIKKSVEQMREGGFFPDLTTPSPVTQRSSAPAPSNNGRNNGRGNVPQGPDTQSNNAPVEIIRQTDELARPGGEPSTLKPQESYVAGKAMQFSLYYFGNYESEFSPDKYDLLIHGARFGDRHGFSAIWVPERHFHSFGGFSPNPSVVAAAIARETEHISIRAGSVVLPLHHPIRVAEEWSVVDNLSHGRVGISFASGWHPNDFAFAPDSYERRRELMYEGIETVQKLWRGEMVQVRNGKAKEISVKLSPMPMQAALPTWLTGANNTTFIKAGEIGANFLTNLSDQSIEELADKIALYRDTRAKNGYDPQAGHVTVLLHTFVIDNAEQARQKAHDPFLRYLKSSLGLSTKGKGKVPMNVDQLSPEDLNYILESGFERHLKTGALIGTPEQCAPIVDRLIESGVNEIGCLIDFGIDTPSVLDSLQHLNVLRAKYEKPGAVAAAQNAQTIEVRSAAESSTSAGESIDARRQVALTEAQKQLWLATQMGEDASRAYNESATMQLRGSLDVAAMQRALQKLVDRHEALRTTFSSDGVYQQYLPSLNIEVPFVDFSHVEPDKRETQVAMWTSNEGNRLFDLVKGPLINFQIAKLEEQYHHLLFVYHHLVADGQSWSVLLGELLKLYAAERRGLPCELPAAVPFREYADRQAAILEGPSASRAESYWVEQFHDRVPVLELPTDQPRPLVPTFNGAQEVLATPPQLFDDLKQLRSQLGSTMFMLLLSAYDVLLHRLSGQDDLVMGVSSAGQSTVARNTVGYCVNMLPIRSKITGNPSFATYLNSIKRLMFASAENQNYSFGKLIEKLNLRVDAGRSPFFSATFNIDRAGVGVQFDDLMAEINKNFTGSARFDISFNLVETDKELILKCNYNSDLFHAHTIQSWLKCYRTILESIAVNPEQRVLDLPLLTDLEREEVLEEWNRTGAAYGLSGCVHEVIEQQAARTQEALAVVCEEEGTTYGELNRRANQLAHYLRSCGVGVESRVGLLLERSVESVIALLGVMKAGAAYVPLDVAQPAVRLGWMLADAGVEALITRGELAVELAAGVKLIRLDEQASEIERQSEENPAAGAQVENLAYVIYTSGSTGQAKGIGVEHRQLLNYIGAISERLREGEAGAPRSYATVSTFAADLGHTMIFPALCSGATLHVITAERAGSSQELGSYMREQEVECLKIVPSHLQALLSGAGADGGSVLPARWLVLGGEAASAELVRRVQELQPGCRVMNHYGPTETTVGVLAGEVKPEAVVGHRARVALGRPLGNVRAYILDEAGAGVLPVWLIGELYIGGASVGRGYLKNAAETAARFVPDPYSEQGGARMYRTGDRARWRADGQVEFLGRVDHQVKVRGYRVELGEVEAVLREHEEVAESVVVLREERLVGYYVSRSKADGERRVWGAASEQQSRELRSWLSARLPEYMVPWVLLEVERLPLTANGKIDVRALPAPEEIVHSSEGSYVAPRTEIEEVLAGIWSKVLRVERVGVRDNFFDMGGNSLLGTQIIARVRNIFEVPMSLRTLFESPTIARMAELVSATPEPEDAAAVIKIDTSKNADELLTRLDELRDDQVDSLLSELLAEQEAGRE